jgi:hypothetical protein
LEKKVDASLQDSSGDTALHIAAKTGHAAIVLRLQDYGVNINAQNGSHQTPLHLAVDKEYEEIARSLLERGANSTLTDGEGFSAFFLAVKRCSIPIAKLFLDRGVDVNISGPYGSSALGVGMHLFGDGEGAGREWSSSYSKTERRSTHRMRKKQKNTSGESGEVFTAENCEDISRTWSPCGDWRQ